MISSVRRLHKILTDLLQLCDNFIASDLYFINGTNDGKEKKINVKKTIGILGLFFISIQTFALDTYAGPKNNLADLDPASAANQELKTRPPLEVDRVAGELLAGIATGALLGYLGSQITQNENSGWMDFSGFPGFIIGFTLGASTAVWAIGSIGNQTGSLGATILGTLLGIASWLPLTLANPFDNDDYIIPGALILAGIGGTAAFNMTRRYSADQPMTALINHQDGKPSINFPRISICPSPSRSGSSWMSVGLVNVGW